LCQLKMTGLQRMGWMLDLSGHHWSMASRGMRSPQAHTRVMESLISLDEE
jgi:hypothetical protein